MAGRQVVSFIIDLKDRASAGLRRINKDGFGSLKVGVSAVTRVMKVGAIALAGYATTAGLLAKRGGEVLEVQRAFGRATGDVEGALVSLRGATDGLINNYDLMVGFNRAVTLGAAENVEQFEELSKTAVTLGRALGVDAAFAMESLSLGIGRQSRLILDNLGLIVSVEEANASYAEQIGKTTSQLTQSEKAIAFRNAAMDAAKTKIEALGGVETNAGDAVTRFVVAVQNARDEIAKLAAQSPLIRDFFNTLTSLVDDFVVVIGDGGDSVRTGFEELGIIAGNAFSASFLQGIVSLFDALQAMVVSPLEKFAEFFGFEVDIDGFIQSLNPIRGLLTSTIDEAEEQITDALTRVGVLIDAAAARAEGVRAAAVEEGGAGFDTTLPDFLDPEVIVPNIFEKVKPPPGPRVRLDALGDMPGQIEALETPLDKVLSKWQEIGLAVNDATADTESLGTTIGTELVNGMQSFSQAFISGIMQWRQGTKTLGEALKGAFLGALANIAAGFAQFYTAQAAAALAQGLLGDPRGYAAAAKYTAAALGMGVLAGVAASAAGGAGSGGSVGGADFQDRFAASGRGSGGTIIIQGGLLDMSDPVQADRFSDALEEMTGLRINVQGG